MYFLELNDILFLVKSLKFPTPAFNIYNYVSFNTSTTRSRTFNKLIHNFTPTSHAHHFYFNRIVRLWNLLPYIDSSLTINTIKSNLHDFFGIILLHILTLTIRTHFITFVPVTTAHVFHITHL